MKRIIFFSVLLFSASNGVWAQGNSEEAKGDNSFANGQYRQAIPHYQRAMDLQEASDQAELNLLRSFLYGKRHDDAVKLMDVLDEEHQQDPEYLALQGDFYRQLGDWETAKSAFEQALVLDQSNASLHLRLGQALSELGDDEAADLEYAEYKQLSGN